MPHRPATRALVAPALLALAATLFVAAAGSLLWMDAGADVVVGVPEGTGTPTSGPSIPPSTAPAPPPEPVALGAGRPEPGPGAGLAVPDGQPWRPAIPFVSSVPVPDHLVFVLVIGSDARPGQDPTRARADSLHLLALNPSSGQGTIVGFPRDSWVDIPGHGRGKINSALSLGGPGLAAETVRRLTGLPVHYYVVTGFQGFQHLVDELGGLDVHVGRRMDDPFSGARFEPGWHHFTGGEALAFSRNRKDTAHGDFSRSEHHGIVMLSALAKMRAEVGDDSGIHHWAGTLLRHVHLDLPAADLVTLTAAARRLDPARVANVVVPGRAGKAGRQSVVFVDPGAAILFDDLRADAVIGPADLPPPPPPTTAPPPPPPEPPPSSTTTTRPLSPL